MKVLKNFITPDQITLLKNHWVEQNHCKYINWQINDTIIDHRLTISPKTELFNILKDQVIKDFPNYISMWSALQQQTNPHSIHIDDYGNDFPNCNRYTYIIALDTVPEFKTIVWKDTAWDNDDLYILVRTWGETIEDTVKKSNISEIEDLEHTFDENQQKYLCDYLDLDGIFQYHAGDACLFDATQLHCTSNWRKYPQYQSRQLLQIHVLVPG